VATVGAVITDLLYTAISLALVHMVGQTLSRNSRAFLPQKPGQDGMAEAATRVLVVAYYLVALGFIALTMPTWSHVSSPGQAMELLSVQVGILLLVLGGLHLAGTAVLARLRRHRPRLTQAAPAGPGMPVAATADGFGAAAADGFGAAAAEAASAGEVVSAGEEGDPPGEDGPDGPAADAQAADGAGARSRSSPFWRPQPRNTVH
jgi:hypothetical protein